jgi:hypothetical protein
LKYSDHFVYSTIMNEKVKTCIDNGS